ncbi:hypothetical protein [Tomitella biformata]|uniref:hypothetical protein n=1 Tax=Tomitella biformata TaxID=630403 RepID=UPI000465C5BE|nr:hypothetical protein [Tomitella biformata]
MIGQSEQMGEELRSVLSAVIAAVEPMLGQLAAPDAPAGNCTWCPVCALVALSRGEQHPLLTAISVHGVALLAILRDVLADAAATHAAQTNPDVGAEAAEPGQPESGPADAAESAEPAGRRRPTFERITVNLTGADRNGARR